MHVALYKSSLLKGPVWGVKCRVLLHRGGPALHSVFSKVSEHWTGEGIALECTRYPCTRVGVPGCACHAYNPSSDRFGIESRFNHPILLVLPGMCKKPHMGRPMYAHQHMYAQ
eukprot:2102272-Rhodomonas_salina.1